MKSKINSSSKKTNKLKDTPKKKVEIKRNEDRLISIN